MKTAYISDDVLTNQGQLYINTHTHTHARTHTHIYIYIYIYILDLSVSLIIISIEFLTSYQSKKNISAIIYIYIPDIGL